MRSTLQPSGAVEFGKDEDAEVGIYLGTECLEDYISVGAPGGEGKSGATGLSASVEELADSNRIHDPEVYRRQVRGGETVQRFHRH